MAFAPSKFLPSPPLLDLGEATTFPGFIAPEFVQHFVAQRQTDQFDAASGGLDR